jgi:PTS system fructose-specific IIA component/PTS system nitrogen regulatory IIA component
MKFSDFVVREAVRADLSADSKETVIRQMVQTLVDAKKVPAGEYDNIIKAILKREELGSTGIGRGVAVPHTKYAGAKDLIGAVAVSPDGVDFDSLDGEKVYLFFLLISPHDRPGDHLRALENVSRQLRDDGFCKHLKQARSPGQILELLDEADNNQFGS